MSRIFKNIIKNIYFFSFLYEGSEINFKLSFDNYSKSKNEITKLVNEKYKEK